MRLVTMPPISLSSMAGAATAAGCWPYAVIGAPAASIAKPSAVPANNACLTVISGLLRWPVRHRHNVRWARVFMSGDEAPRECRLRQYSRAWSRCTWNPLRKGYKQAIGLRAAPQLSQRNNGLEETCAGETRASDRGQTGREPTPRSRLAAPALELGGGGCEHAPPPPPSGGERAGVRGAAA